MGVASEQSDMQPVQEEEVVREEVVEVEARRTRGGWWRMRRAPTPKWKLRPGRTEDNRWMELGVPGRPRQTPFGAAFEYFASPVVRTVLVPVLQRSYFENFSNIC